MTTSTNYSLKVLTTGFMVLVFFAILMFWGRYFSAIALRAGLPSEARRVEISPSGLLAEAVENDPNAHRQSSASGSIDDDVLVDMLGFYDYVLSKSPGGRRSDVLYYEEDKAWMYFDRSTGHLVLRHRSLEPRNGRDVARLTIPYYAGPNGISKSPGADLGRFIDPVVPRQGSLPRIVYDKKLRRFFGVNVDVMTVEMGPELGGAVSHEPVRIGSLRGHEGVYVHCQPTMRRVPRANQTDSRRQYNWRFNMYCGLGDTGQYVTVVDASGRIDLLDRNTLELVAGKGYLPTPKTLYGQGGGKPNQLLDYEVTPVRFGNDPRDGMGIDWEYAGMVVGSLSRQGTSMTLAVFDKDGKLLRTSDSKAISYRDKAWTIQTALDDLAQEGTMQPAKLQLLSTGSAQAALFEVPGGKARAIFLYGMENLHPLALTMASFCVANRVEARASHRALFLTPNSFAAMYRDMVQHDIFTQFFRALVLLLPAVLLAFFLAWRVVRDAKIVGLSSNVRLLWVLGILGFGLPAYITYCLTRPKAALVTCVNCGLPRRPDRDRCHRCNGPWRVPELNPPAWHVLDGGRKDIRELPAKPEDGLAQ